MSVLAEYLYDTHTHDTHQKAEPQTATIFDPATIAAAA